MFYVLNSYANKTLYVRTTCICKATRVHFNKILFTKLYKDNYKEKNNNCDLERLQSNSTTDFGKAKYIFFIKYLFLNGKWDFKAAKPVTQKQLYLIPSQQCRVYHAASKITSDVTIKCIMMTQES